MKKRHSITAHEDELPSIWRMETEGGAVAAVCLRLALVEQPPERNPQKTGERRDQKRSAKTVMLQQINDERRRDGGADHAAAVEDADGQRAVFLFEQARQCFYAAGVGAALARSFPELR